MPTSQSNNMNRADRHNDGNYSDPEEDDIQRYLGASAPGGPAMTSQINSRRRQRADSDEQHPNDDTANAFTTLMHSLLAPALISQRPRTPNPPTQNNSGNAQNSNQSPPPNPNRPTLPFSLFGPSAGGLPGSGGRGPRPGTVVTTRIVLSNGQGPPVTHVYGNMPGNEPVPDLAMYVPSTPSPFSIPSNNNASAPHAGTPSDGNVVPSIPPSVGSPNTGNSIAPASSSPAAILGTGTLAGSPGLGQRPRLARYNTRVLVIIIRGPADDTRRIFTEMMNNMGGPAGAPQSAGAAGANPFIGVNPLHAILASLMNPGAAAHGDAVYTQEALDRVITQLMEQHQSSGAAPPAPREAIEKLPLKKADEKMVGVEGKAGCPVCMEDVVLNDEVVELPCKHWFHEECAKSWLKEHNTCPICRKPISEDAPRDHNDRGDPTGTPRGQSSSNNPQSGPPPPYAPPAFTFFNSGPRRTSNESRPERRDRLDSIRRAGGVTYDEDHPPSIPGSFRYEPPSERTSRPADGTPGGRSFADPSSGAFLDFMNAPSSRPMPRGIDPLIEDDDRFGSQRAGLRLRRENSFPLVHERHSGPMGHNPYVDNFDGARGGVGHRRTSDEGSWRTTRSAESRYSTGSNANGERQGGGLSGVLGGLWRRFSGQNSNQTNSGSNNQGR